MIASASKTTGLFSSFITVSKSDRAVGDVPSPGPQAITSAPVSYTHLEKDGVDLGIRHISNSAGIMEAPEVQMDMVRNGICLYGLYPSEEVQKERLPLKPAMELKAYVSYVKTLEPGVEIGYGGTYTTCLLYTSRCV